MGVASGTARLVTGLPRGFASRVPPEGRSPAETICGVPHTFECQLRWADMDLLGHVNNVTYLDYVTEAREALFAGHPVRRAPVVRHQVEFARPLVFRRRPVLVDTWVTDLDDDGVTLAHEVYDAPVDESTTRTVYLRATTALAHALSAAERGIAESVTGPAQEWRAVADGVRPPGSDYTLTVRRSLVDVRGRQE